MTYLLNGKQYIAVAIGGANLPAELIALHFALIRSACITCPMASTNRCPDAYPTGGRSAVLPAR